MAKKQSKPKSPSPILNRRARFDYDLGDEIVAGLSLTGIETRAAREGHVQLKGAFVSLKDGELWLNNASFSLKLNEKGLTNTQTVDTSPRKLLAHRKQIDAFADKKQHGMTIVPTKLLTTGRHIKLVIALGKGKRRYDKRQSLKKRDELRDANRAINNI